MDDKISRVLALYSQKLVDIAIQACDAAGITLKRIGDRYQGICPLHENADNPTAFVVYASGEKQRWTCFTHCGHGDVIDFIAAWKRISVKEAIEYLNEGVQMTHEEMQEIATKRRIEAEAYERQKKLEYEAAVASLQQARKWEEYYSMLLGNDIARDLWRARGIPDTWQDIWELGYCDSFKYKVDDVVYTSPTLAIPVRDEKNRIANIKHRLLMPMNPKDKYRPERTGLGDLPFIADAEKGYSQPTVLVVEGEIKAMVTYITLDNPNVQVVGMSGKGKFHSIAEKLKEHNVYVLFDPDAIDKAMDAAKMVKGRVINIRCKVDDAINEGYLDKWGMKNLMRFSEKV